MANCCRDSFTVLRVFFGFFSQRIVPETHFKLQQLKFIYSYIVLYMHGNEI